MSAIPAHPDPWTFLRDYTPARIALGRAGSSLPTVKSLEFQLAHARARDAVRASLQPAALQAAIEAAGFEVVSVRSAAQDRVHYLQRPDLGKQLAESSRAELAPEEAGSEVDAVFVVADGLSAQAVHRHALPLLQAVVPSLRDAGWQIAPIVIAEQARVAIGDAIGELMRARLTAILIGERPGLSAPDSLGVYLTYNPRPGVRDSDRNCISNIRPEGLSYALAARRLLFLMTEARRRKLTGVALKDETLGAGVSDEASWLGGETV